MNTLKPDLKILISFFSLLFISCTTNKVDSVSLESPLIQNDTTPVIVYDILEVEEVEITNVSNYRYIENEDPGRVDLDPLSIDRSSVKKISPVFPVISMEVNELELIIPNYTIHKRVVVKKPIVKAPLVKKTPPKKTTSVASVPKKVVKAPVVKKSIQKSVNKPVEKEPMALAPMSVVIGESFTVEMDQTGWIYEDEIDGLEFVNKFYAGDKVLFEFVLSDPAVKEVRFSKYSTGNRVQSLIPLNILETKREPRSQIVITPTETIKSLSEKDLLEKELEAIDKSDNPDEVYFKLAEIYLEEGKLRKAKEYYEYIYDNYPLSLYYEDARSKMEYILDNFLISR